MDSSIRELCDFVLRWMHVIAGIMWVGNSLLFNWLDRNLEKVQGRRKEHVGRIWLLHSGAFYDVEKTMLPPGELPPVMHWFKWQSYTTWITGISLLMLVYYLGDNGFLVDASSGISPDLAKDLGIATLLLGYASYESIWRLLGKRHETLAQALTITWLIALVLWSTHVFAGRAAFIHVGAVLGTCMSGNVFMHIMPAQRELVKATAEGRDQDLSYSMRAKQRSIHNNYMTFPLIALMVSNHFPSSYGNRISWLVLLWILVSGASVRHILNVRSSFKQWIPALATVLTVAIVGLGYFFGAFRKEGGSAMKHEPVAFSRVQMVMQERCVTCHSAHPTDDVYRAPPSGVMFDTPEQIKGYVSQIKVRAVVSKTMPQGNKTKMTEEERALLADWILGGAQIDK